MIRNLIAPIQAWLLSQKRCVGCGTSLLLGQKKEKNKKILVICKCKRIYVLDSQKNTYRRAELDEV